MSLSGPWGTLDATAGARITNDWSRIYVPASSRPQLRLADGWVVGEGKRKGDLLIARQP